MTPFASVAMLEKLALLKIALCKASAVSSASCRRLSVMVSTTPVAGSVSCSNSGIEDPPPRSIMGESNSLLDMVHFRGVEAKESHHQEVVGLVSRGSAW